MKRKNLENRVHLIDEIRGFAIICMVVYHAFYDIVVIFGVDIPLFYTDFIYALVVLFAGIFIFISGTSCLFSRNNLKRGFVCFMLGMIITTFTILFMKDSLDLFGILHMLGCCMMLFPLVSPLIKKIHPVVGLVVCLLLWGVTYNLSNGYLFMGDYRIDMPDVWYTTQWLFPLGLPSRSFTSVDYFPLIPWIFCFYAGSFLGVMFKEHRLPASWYKLHIRPLAFVGRHTLLIYILHQPIIFPILALVFWVF